MVEQEETIKMTGDVTLILKDIEGNIKEERNINNMVVTVGKNFIAARLATTPAIMSHMGIGTSTAAAAVGNTNVTTPAGARVALSGSSPFAVVTNNVVSYSANFPAGHTGGTVAVTEAGIFNAASGGTMLARVVFLPVNKTADDSLTIIWNITIN